MVDFDNLLGEFDRKNVDEMDLICAVAEFRDFDDVMSDVLRCKGLGLKVVVDVARLHGKLEAVDALSGGEAYPYLLKWADEYIVTSEFQQFAEAEFRASGDCGDTLEDYIEENRFDLLRRFKDIRRFKHKG